VRQGLRSLPPTLKRVSQAYDNTMARSAAEELDKIMAEVRTSPLPPCQSNCRD
jgi:hypothetical protein